MLSTRNIVLLACVLAVVGSPIAASASSSNPSLRHLQDTCSVGTTDARNVLNSSFSQVLGHPERFSEGLNSVICAILKGDGEADKYVDGIYFIAGALWKASMTNPEGSQKLAQALFANMGFDAASLFGGF
eukprot:GHVT01100591.1.p1 GENE.GHVT01100591.1~~GHVT01100591.1.p1  ORF type:complete len:130 (-),score=5.13 GHVT01100591.1:982-1371(-)